MSLGVIVEAETVSVKVTTYVEGLGEEVRFEVLADHLHGLAGLREFNETATEAPSIG